MQQLDINHVKQAMQQATEKHIPLTVAVKSAGWQNMHSRFVAMRDGKIYVEMPIPQDRADIEFSLAERIDMVFKLRHHKYLAWTRIAGIEKYTKEDGTEIDVLCLCHPMHVQRVQRRNFARVAVPQGKIARVNFLSDGYDDQSHSDDFEFFSGRILDISAGGFQAEVPADALPKIGIGQIFSLRISFGPDEPSIYVDAQFRHCSQSRHDKSMVSMGLQFVGLNHSRMGKQALRQINMKMNEYSKINQIDRNCHTSKQSA